MRHKNRESGYILVGVLLAVTILAVVGTSLVTLSTSSVKTSFAERDNQAVYYIAEAGLNHLANEFEEAVEEIYEKDHVKTEADFYSEIDKFNELPVEYDNFEKVNDDKPKALLDIEKIDEEIDKKTVLYKMTSTGDIGDEKRVVTQQVQVEWRDKYKEVEGGSPITPIINTPPFAVFTSGQFTMSNGTIIGDIGTVNDKSNGISFPSGGGPTLDGKIYVPGGDNNIVNKADYLDFTIEEIDTLYEIPSLPPFPDYPTNIKKYPDGDLVLNWNDESKYTLNLTEDLEINRLHIPNGLHDFTINLNGQDRIIVVNKLESMGSINITGNGKLTMMVKSGMKFGSGSINSEENVKKLDIFYAGTEEPNFGDNMKIFGNLYSKKANLTISGSSGIQGNVLSGGSSIIITGGSENIAQMFFAPNANIQFTGGGKLKGKVIADRFTISGGGTVDFSAPDIDDDLFNPDLPDDSEDGSGGTGGSGGSELIETGAKPTLIKGKVREEAN